MTERVVLLLALDHRDAEADRRRLKAEGAHVAIATPRGGPSGFEGLRFTESVMTERFKANDTVQLMLAYFRAQQKRRHYTKKEG